MHRSSRAGAFVVGGFPPPVHGFAVVTQSVYERLAAAGPTVRFDHVGRMRTGLRAADRLLRAIRLHVLLVRYAWGLVRVRPRSVLIESSANGIQLFDAVCAGLGILAGAVVIVHHHSFAYLQPETTRWFHRIAFLVFRHCRHVALCTRMQSLLHECYGIDRGAIAVVSNAAFIPEPPAERQCRAGGAPLCLGFISNITAAKGIFAFLDVVESLAAAGQATVGLVAGPVEPALEREFMARVKAIASVRYVGAVEGEAKSAFFERIDLLVFPTRHVHEAEPLVVLEALSYGVPVLAAARGCMTRGWGNSTAVRALEEATFVEQAHASVGALLADHRKLLSASKCALAVHRKLHQEAEVRLEKLITEILGKGPAIAGGAPETCMEAKRGD
jgi:glycosyltransferase involved in cell wall biosynthesis